mmetsp:Transcript_22814/g.46661  ORF Transcript_22814/g.46661 Transcript_22814/m.46661 type:complete len:129 (-) Transcript_22814:113-499(-)
MARLGVLAVLLVLPMVVIAFSPLSPTNSMMLRGAANQNRAMRASHLPFGPKMMADGDREPIFEDDVDAGAPAKQQRQGGISDSMKARLLKESQAMGGDPDAPSINFAVVIGGVIAFLAVFGSIFGAFG